MANERESVEKKGSLEVAEKGDEKYQVRIYGLRRPNCGNYGS